MATNKKCDVCNTVHSSEIDYNNHVLGNKHKRKASLIDTDAQNKTRKQLYEKNGIFIFNVPVNTRPHELLAYVSGYGKVNDRKFGLKYAKFLFDDEKSAIDFKKKRHIFKGQPLKVTAWNLQIPTLVNTPNVVKEAVNAGKHPDIDVASLLSEEDMGDIDEELVALQSMMMTPDFITFVYHKLCNDIRNSLRRVWNDFSIHPFGSMITGLALKGSDIDVVVDTTFTLFQHERQYEVFQSSFKIDKKQMQTVARPLRSYFDRVIIIDRARVPIIKCVHRATSISCDISFKNVVAVQNSHLIRRYVSADPRVKSLLIILKYWALYFELTKSGFTNYALVMMGLYYLMQLDQPLIPTVFHLERNSANKLYIEGWNCSFDISYHFPESRNTSSILDLLLGFFDFYASFDYGMYVICPRIGKALPKISFGNVNFKLCELTSSQLDSEAARKQMSCLKVNADICVQDPFLLDCNITNAVSHVHARHIQAMCTASAYVLREDRGTSGPLKHLFKERTEELALEPSLMNKNPANQNVEIRINVSNYVPLLPVTVSDAQNTWYNQVFDTVRTIFEDIFKFETTENDRLSIKRLKTEENNADNSEMNGTDTRILICDRTGPDLCSNRKLGKTLIDYKMSFLEVQKAVTAQILAQEEIRPIDTVKIECSFRMHKDPTFIVVELSDLGSSDGVFDIWSKFLSGHLVNWVRHIMNL